MFRDIVEVSSDGIWLFELTGRTIYANPAMAAMAGRTVAEMATTTVPELLDEQGRADYARHLRAVQDGRVNRTDVEVLLHRPDGTAIWTLASETVLEADAELGLPRRVLLRFSDWGDRRALIEREAGMRETLASAEELSGVGSWSLDVGTGVAVPTDGLLRMLDLPARPLVREDLLRVMHPEDRARMTGYRDWDPGTGPYAYEARLRTRDEGYRWFSGRVARRFAADGREIRISTVVDIHDRRSAERAMEDAVLQHVLLQAAAASANEARSFEEGLRLAQQLIIATGDWERARAFVPDPGGGPPLSFYVNEVDRLADEADPEHVPVERALAARCMDECRILWEEEAWAGGPVVAFPVQVPGEIVAVGVISSHSPIERPDMIRTVLAQAGSQMARVAERDRAARELARARDAAMEASRQKSDFLATMSHEIRTPLNGVIGLNELLLRTALDGDQHRLVTGIQVSSRSLLGVINDILDFSKIEAGHLALEETDFDVRAVLDQTAAVLSEPARARGLELVASCDPDVPALVAGDPTRLAQVLTNLGANAVKFTESGAVRLRVRRAAGTPYPTGEDDPDAPAGPGEGGKAVSGADGRTVHLAVEVTDTGVGISPEQQRAVFDPFAQADASTTRRFGGTGLGLAICREIVEALGGRIGVVSAPGRGSLFWFTARFAPATGPGLSDEDQAARAALSGRRVLVVDDHENPLADLAEQVGWWGVRGTTVGSVAEAVAALDDAEAHGEVVDLVLMDLVSPERDAVALAADVRARPALGGVPLLLLTPPTVPGRAPGQAPGQLWGETLGEAGIAGSLAKPLLASTLRTLLLRYLAPDDPAPPSTGALPPPGAAPDEDEDRLRVLVVEDNEVNQLVATGLLDALGYANDVVGDGDGAVQAVAAAAPGHYGAVLMDLQMPRVDGFEATRAIRELERGSGRVDPERGRIPVIAMTASAIAGERERCLEAGMDDFMTKPVDPRTLAVMMDRWSPRPVLEPGAEAGAGDGSGEAPGAGPAEGLAGPLDRERLDMLHEMDEEGTYLARVIARFESKHSTLVGAVADAVAQADPVALRASAHSLKGTLTNLGLVQAGELVLELEQLGTEGRTDPPPDLLPAVRDAVAEGLDLLRDYRAALRQRA